MKSEAIGKKNNTLIRIIRARGLYLMLLIPVVYVFIFNYIPMYGVIIAFKRFNPMLGFFKSEWVGLYQFERFFNSPAFVKVVSNTVILSLYSLVAGFPLPILMAVGLNHMRSRRMKSAVQMITFMPYFFSTVIMVGLLTQLLNSRFGLVNVIIMSLGGKAQDFLGDPNLFRHIYVWSGVWQGMGYGSVIYLAALSSVDQELHEAAIIDGANIWQRIWYIDIPCILPTIVIMLVLSTGGIMSVGFEKTYLLQTPLNLSVSEVIETYVYRMGIAAARPDYSFGTAVGLFQNVVALTMMVIVNTVSKKISGSGLF